jgi:uncharacterized protein YjbJ (UPF0337 family)
MNWDRIAGSWKQFKGRARRRSGKPAQDDLATAATRDASEKQLAKWVAGRHEVDPIHK